MARGMYQFSEDSEFLKWDWTTFVNYSVGELILSIATGEFQDKVVWVMSKAIAWGKHNGKKF